MAEINRDDLVACHGVSRAVSVALSMSSRISPPSTGPDFFFPFNIYRNSSTVLAFSMVWGSRSG